MRQFLTLCVNFGPYASTFDPVRQLSAFWQMGAVRGRGTFARALSLRRRGTPPLHIHTSPIMFTLHMYVYIYI
jgi:hypothetical protein